MKLSKTKLFIFTALISTQINSEALAKENFYGVEGNLYVGVDYLSSRVEHTYNNNGTGYVSPDGGRSENDNSGIGLNTGYKFKKNNIFISPEIFYEKLSAKTKDFHRNNLFNGDNSLKINDRYGARFALGYDLSEKFSTFVSYGVARTQSEITFVNVNSQHRDRHNSSVYGLGASYNINKNLSAKVSYDQQWLKINYDTYGEKDRIKIKTFKIGLVYNF